ncbi:MAG: hypothetical protein EYC70_17065 [Planctomycetota bacterium]|nr:MAG: hypothetical protein EYC70_17065 [Planctomycetota bacterium]
MILSAFFQHWSLRRRAAAGRGTSGVPGAPVLDQSDWEFVAEIWSPRDLSRRAMTELRRLPSAPEITAALQAFRESSERSAHSERSSAA